MKMKLVRLMLSTVLVLGMISCSSNEKADLTIETAKKTNYSYQPDETELADLINEHRVSLGLNALEIVNHISFKCREHDDYMIEKNVVNYDLFEQRSQNIMQVDGATKVNENIAYNFTSSASALNAWLNSPAHKANIEGDFTHFGISIRIDPQTGKKYYTNIFIKK